MRYLRQFSIILAFSFAGEVLNRLLPLPVPAAIYGLVLLLLALQFRWVRLEQLQPTGAFLLEAMTIMFIPFAVALIPAWPEMRAFLLPILVISVVSTLLVMLVTGRVAQWCIRREDWK